MAAPTGIVLVLVAHNGKTLQLDVAASTRYYEISGGSAHPGAISLPNMARGDAHTQPLYVFQCRIP